MSKVKGLLFDFNGTLFFDSEYHIEAFFECFRKYGLAVPDRKFIVENIFGRTNEAIFLQHYRSDATKEEITEFEQLKESMYMEKCKSSPERLKLCDGAAEILDYLKEHSIPFCIATGSPLENVNFYFEYLDLGRWFTLDNIVYCDGSFAGKPAPDIYELAAKRLGLDCSECAVFEDGTSGMRSANAARAARVIGVWEQGLPSPLSDGVRVDAVYHDLSNWREILRSIGLLK